MSARDGRSQQTRARIADLAAVFVAEHGIRDYGLAKRKALRHLGLPEGHNLPSNEEVDTALMQRQSLYEPDEQAALLDALRRQAQAVMRVFAQFDPNLSGGVATGAVSEHSLIELDISADSSKDFEQYLVNQNIEFKIQDRAGQMAYLIYSEPTDVLVRLMTPEGRRNQSGQRPRLTLPQLDKLLRAGG